MQIQHNSGPGFAFCCQIISETEARAKRTNLFSNKKPKEYEEIMNDDKNESKYGNETKVKFYGILR